MSSGNKIPLKKILLSCTSAKLKMCPDEHISEYVQRFKIFHDLDLDRNNYPRIVNHPGAAPFILLHTLPDVPPWSSVKDYYEDIITDNQFYELAYRSGNEWIPTLSYVGKRLAEAFSQWELESWKNEYKTPTPSCSLTQSSAQGSPKTARAGDQLSSEEDDPMEESGTGDASGSKRNHSGDSGDSGTECRTDPDWDPEL